MKLSLESLFTDKANIVINFMNYLQEKHNYCEYKVRNSPKGFGDWVLLPPSSSEDAYCINELYVTNDTTICNVLVTSYEYAKNKVENTINLQIEKGVYFI